MLQELNDEDKNTLANLLLSSSKVKTRESLCIRIGISYYRQLGFINDVSDESFAINLINHLNEVGNIKALCELCCKELEPIFRGGKRELILREIIQKLTGSIENKNNYQNKGENQNLNSSEVLTNGSISRKTITMLGKNERLVDSKIKFLYDTPIIVKIAIITRVSASQTLLTNGFYESVELGKAAAKTEIIY